MKDKDPKDISDLLSDLKIKDNENNLGQYTIKKLDVIVDIKILYNWYWYDARKVRKNISYHHVSPKKRSIFIFKLFLVTLDWVDISKKGASNLSTNIIYIIE